MPALSWPPLATILAAITTPEKMESIAFPTVVKPVRTTWEPIMKPLIAKANVDFAPCAMPLPKLLSLDADTAKMELMLALLTAKWERNIAELVLRLATCNL